MTKLLLTALGEDRPGLVSALATAVEQAGGNWLESQMAHLAGSFAGIVLVHTDAEDALREALRGVEGLTVTVAPAGDAEPATGEPYLLSVVGQDRPGIVAAVSAAAARSGATIEELHTATRPAPMGAGLLFEADAVLRLTGGATLRGVREALEGVADDLVVDLDVATADAAPDSDPIVAG